MLTILGTGMAGIVHTLLSILSFILLIGYLPGGTFRAAEALRQRTNHKACLECIHRNNLWPDRCYNDPNLPCIWDDDYMWRGWNYDVFESENERQDRLAKTGVRTRF